jgi:hypothetical protein
MEKYGRVETQLRDFFVAALLLSLLGHDIYLQLVFGFERCGGWPQSGNSSSRGLSWTSEPLVMIFEAMAAIETGHTRTQATASINFLRFTAREDTHHKHTAHWPEGWQELSRLDAMLNRAISVPVANRISAFQWLHCFIRLYIYRNVWNRTCRNIANVKRNKKTSAKQSLWNILFRWFYVCVGTIFVDKLVTF